MFESHPELEGLESIPDAQEVPSSAIAFIGAVIAVAATIFVMLALFI